MDLGICIKISSQIYPRTAMINQNLNILSYDENKIKSYVDSNGQVIYTKKTTLLEFRNLKRANIYLLNNPIYLLNNIRLLTIKPISFNPKTRILKTHYFEGENLELLLRDKKAERQFILCLIKDFFLKTYKSGFYWGDCAPRNMILNINKNEIGILDFERKLIINPSLKNKTPFLIRHFRNYSYEEFFSFLFMKEQSFLKCFILKEPYSNVPISEIPSKRKIFFLKEYYGYKMHYSSTEIASIEDYFVNAFTPFIYKHEPIFPIIVADKIYENIGILAFKKFIDDFQNFNKKKKYEEIITFKRNI